MNLKPYIITFLIFRITSSLFAQKNQIIIDDNKAESQSTESNGYIANSNAFKFNATAMLVGEINFSYERKIGKKSSVELELGPTISNVGLFVNESHTGNFSDSNRSGKVGFLGAVSFRYFPSEKRPSMNGFYVSPRFKYRILNTDINDPNNNLGAFAEKETDAYFTFNFGIQSWISSSFALDYYAGIGIGYESYKSANLISQYDGNTDTYINSWSPDNYSGARYLFVLGLKIGIGN